MSLTRYSRHHKFQYPEYRRVVRKKVRESDLSGRRKELYRKSARAEDSAGALYKAVRARGDKRKRLMRRLRKGNF